MPLFVAALALSLCAPAAFARSSSGLAPGEHRFTSGAVKLWYRVAGKGTGTPLVFLHGGPGEGSQTFQAVGGPQLERSERLVYFDQRGSGHSQRPKDKASYSLDLIVADIEHLRIALGVPKIAVLGHSFGTVLALEYAARYPTHVSAVVLASSAPDFPALLDTQCKRLENSDPAAYARAAKGFAPDAYPRCNSFNAYQGAEQKTKIYQNMFPDPATGERVDKLDAANGLGNTGEMSSALLNGGLLHYRFVRPARITASVLIIAGGKDFQTVIEPQRALAARLPHAHLIEYPEYGHFTFVEDPERFARDVTSFLHQRR